LCLLIKDQRIPREQIRVVFVGSIDLSYHLPDFLRDAGLNEIVTLQPQVSYEESLAHLQQADAFLLLQPGTTTQIPSKLFDYIGIGKPILAISPKNGATYKLVAVEQLGELADPEASEQIARALERLYQRWMLAGHSNMIAPTVREKFNAKSLTAALAKELDRLSSH
jgi:hypothetical protein